MSASSSIPSRAFLVLSLKTVTRATIKTNDDNNKTETRRTASVLKQEANTQKVKGNVYLRGEYKMRCIVIVISVPF